jgi:hypothetical protein
MKTKSLIIAAASLMAASFANAQGIIFAETFTNGTGNNQPLSMIDWKANIGANATVKDDSDVGQDNPILSSGNFLFTRPDPAYGDWFAWTEKASVADIGDIGLVTNVSMSLRNSSTTDISVQIAFKVSDAWYVSQKIFDDNAGSFTPANLDVKTSTWNSLTFVSGTSLAEGAATTLPISGTVQAVGVFSSDTGLRETVRFDDFTITAIPEPATAALVFGALAGLMLLRRRRRKAARH